MRRGYFGITRNYHVGGPLVLFSESVSELYIKKFCTEISPDGISPSVQLSYKFEHLEELEPMMHVLIFFLIFICLCQVLVAAWDL